MQNYSQASQSYKVHGELHDERERLLNLNEILRSTGEAISLQGTLL